MYTRLIVRVQQQKATVNVYREKEESYVIVTLLTFFVEL
jgi:hypothetical protein